MLATSKDKKALCRSNKICLQGKCRAENNLTLGEITALPPHKCSADIY